MLLTDIRMPFGTGIDLMQWNNKFGPNIPVIAMSGDIESEKETKQFCEVMEISYLSKPLDLSKLTDLVVCNYSLQVEKGIFWCKS